jgi:hypothetical protein
MASIPAGCIFSPTKDPGKPPPLPEYPKLTDPFNVMDALEQAYGAKDSNEIKLIYDVNYQGTSFDPINLNQIPLTWANEVSHVEALARTPTVTSVVLKFPDVKLRETDLSDPPGWAMITVQLITVNIVDGTTLYNLVTGDTFEYHFIPHTPDATSPTDTTWKIVRWTEFQM